MTLAVAVVTADGVVVAADSRTTFNGTTSDGQNMSRVLSDFTHKVFQVGNVAVASYGFAFVNGRNIAGHMGDFVRTEIPVVTTQDGAPHPGPGPTELIEKLKD